MATWQFDFHLIPRMRVFALLGGVPSTLGEETFDSVEWWKDFPLPEDYEKILSSFVPEGRSWSPEIRMWGEEDGNRIDINDAGYVDSIFVRVDVRNRHEQFLEGVIKFATHIDAVLLIADNDSVIEPSPDALVSQIKESNAYRFVEDPQAFFESIRKGDIKFKGSG